MSEKLMIYWILVDIKDNFSIKLNEMIMTMISIDTTLMMMNLWMLRRSLTIFIFNTWTNCTNQQFNQSQFNISESVKSWLNNYVMIKFTKWVDEIYKNDMTMWYFKQTQNEYILW